MKSRNWFLVAGLAIGLAACQDNRTANDEMSEDSSRISNATNPDYNNDVPQATRTNFETKYPTASNVRWVRIDPDDRMDIDNTDVRYNLDANDYQVRFNMDNMDYVAWYDDGTWIYSSARVPDHSLLPAAVNERLRNDYPGYSIVEVDRNSDKDRTMYEVNIEKGSDKWKLLIAENGEVIKKKGRDDNKGTKEKKDIK